MYMGEPKMAKHGMLANVPKSSKRVPNGHSNRLLINGHYCKVMAWGVFFYQCLCVTKLCAEFGRSRIPTWDSPNAFIVLRCVGKEVAHLRKLTRIFFQENMGL